MTSSICRQFLWFQSKRPRESMLLFLEFQFHKTNFLKKILYVLVHEFFWNMSDRLCLTPNFTSLFETKWGRYLLNLLKESVSYKIGTIVNLFIIFSNQHLFILATCNQLIHSKTHFAGELKKTKNTITTHAMNAEA